MDAFWAWNSSEEAGWATTQRANSSSYWGLTLRVTSMNRPCGWWRKQTHKLLVCLAGRFSCQTACLHCTKQIKGTSVHLQYDQVSWRVWLEWKFLTVENFESISFTGLSIDFCWFDGDWEQACVLHSEGSFESKVWLLHFCLCNKGIHFCYIQGTYYMRQIGHRILCS